MFAYTLPFWKKAPFIRLLIPLIAGILIQWYLSIDIKYWYSLLAGSILLTTIFFFIPFSARYQFNRINGILLSLIFLSLGALSCWHNDIRHKPAWFGNFPEEKNTGIIVTLEEPLVEKSKSFKAEATVRYLLQHKKMIEVTGKIIVYFKKDTSLVLPGYGSGIICLSALQEIENPVNTFDYKRYLLFKGITHQLYLRPRDFILLQGKEQDPLKNFLYSTNEKIVRILRGSIKDEKALGLAEALLIGYKNDLDKSLLQSYTNTGVVHIVAISGLHLGLIYGLLFLISRPLQKRKNLNWLRLLLIISGLWLFSLLAGAQPSILRSALMFSCIVLGEGLSRKSSIFNTLALSAFILLCIDPFWLWDIGFQLSYIAVLSIVLFMRPVYNWFYIKNKLLDSIWKLVAVSIAAQILTTPISIFHFHQFPNYFLLTNIVAVPLSSLIVLGEILLCAVAWMPAVALLTGKVLTWMIGLMNGWIERIEALPFSVWSGIEINIFQAILLYIFITAVSFWLMEKVKKGVIVALIALLVFSLFEVL